jgi:L-threonylcarbamoyladenylate synthase
LRVHPDEPQPDRIDYIVSCLRKGGVVALPTDTFYGLAVDPVNLYAVEQIYQIKTRQKHKPLSLLISGLAQAYELARDTDPQLDKLADRFWPGPLTIIVRAGTKLPLRSTANTGNVALRVPDAAIPRAVVERFGLPITATSANCRARRSARTQPASATRSAIAFRSSSTAALPAARSPPPSSISRWARAAGRFCARARSRRTKSSWS